MTKEQIRDDVLIKMSRHIDKNALAILNDILTEDLAKFGETTEVATADNTNEYLLEMFYMFKGQKLSDKTMKAYKFTLDKFMTFCQKNLTQVTSVDIECFLAKMRKSNSEVSVNNYRRNLSAFFTWLVKKHIVTFNPCLDVEPYKEIRKPIDHIETVEMEKIKQGCRTTRDRAMIEFFRCTALRVEESVNIKISDIDFIKGSLVIFGEKTKCYRMVFLDDIAMYYIKQYVNERGLKEDSDEFLFVSERGNHSLTVCGIQNAISEIGKRVGVHLYVHLFRKSCATNIVRRGGSIADSGIYLGHKDSTVTGKHYTYIDDQQRRNIFDQYVRAV